MRAYTVAQEFYRPIITPYELTIALAREPTWGTRYELDFGRILSDSSVSAKAEEKAETGEEEHDPDAPNFSLVTGKYRTATRYHGMLYLYTRPCIMKS